MPIDIQKRNRRQQKWMKDAKDRINFLMPKGRKAEILEAATNKGISASEWLNEAIVEKLDKERANHKTGGAK